MENKNNRGKLESESAVPGVRKPYRKGNNQAACEQPASPKISHNAWEEFLLSHQALIAAVLEAEDLAALDRAMQDVLVAVHASIDGSSTSADMNELLSYMGCSGIPGLRSIPGKRRELRAATRATFNQKRRLMREDLNLSTSNVIMKSDNLRLMTRNREDTKGLNRKFLLDVSLFEHQAEFADEAEAQGHGYIEVGREGWLIIEPEQSCVIRNDEGHIEFAVMRGAAGHDGLIDLVGDNVRKAASNLRGLRPTEPGSVTAFGLSAGPRHCRMFGHAKNLLHPNRFTENEITKFHHNLLAGSTVIWKIAESRLPAEIMQPLIAKLEGSGLPGIFTSHIEEGTGFTLPLGGKEYHFTGSPHGPPEVYHSANYSSKGRRAHSERTYTEFAVAYHALRAETTDEHHPFVSFGGDFVDIGLKVLMRASSDTLFAFRANHLHGTTPMRCIEQLGIVYPFSERIKVAYEKAQDAKTIILEDVVTAAPGASVVSHHI
ncbi:hypothetical protein FS837_006571 [Tulasnella sp. UAMH 9824]|nr:hypothetical protein FS837_006571 [Tulasnella sp. UAMH 9824]